MVQYKSKEELEIMRISCLLVETVHAEIAKVLKPGMSTLQINDLATQVINDHGATPSFLNYNGFPYGTCISVNDVIVHGFPNDTVIEEGDLLSVDIGVYKNGFHGDSAYTYAVGKVSEEHAKLLRVTKESLYLGIQKATVGNRIGDIAFAIQEHAEKKNGYGIVRELVGHGLGRSLHEDPQVPNYGKKGTGQKLKPGMVIAIEPMVNLGTKEIIQDDDGWTIRTQDGKFAAHFEHDICIQKEGPDILTSFAEIEKAEQNNPNLSWNY